MQNEGRKPCRLFIATKKSPLCRMGRGGQGTWFETHLWPPCAAPLSGPTNIASILPKTAEIATDVGGDILCQPQKKTEPYCGRNLARLVDDALLRLGLVDVGSLPWSWDEADLLRRFKLWADNEYLALASWGLYRRESASIHRARIGGDDENLSC